MTIGDSIRAARKSRGLTQNELAHAMGITGSAIGQYECGVRIPKYETVERISSALSVPTSSLMPVVSSEIERLTARCARYAEEIAVAQERQRWIPVTERLPEATDGDYVLACVTWKDTHIDYQNAVVMAFVSEEGLVDVEMDCVLDGVTHWMPLPEPPEVE